MQNSECRILKKGLALSDPELVEGESKGFTLIELLVVMAIIGILAALALTSFNTAQKNSRDTRRKSDLQQYRNAMEAYASNNSGVYPVGESGASCNDTGIFQTTPEDAGPIITEYLPAKIPEPKELCGGNCGDDVCTYRFLVNSTGTEYVLGAPLETGGIWQICSKGLAGKVVGCNIVWGDACDNSECDL